MRAIMRQILFRRRVRAARAWSAAARCEAAAHDAAIRLIVDLDVPDPAGRRTAR